MSQPALFQTTTQRTPDTWTANLPSWVTKAIHYQPRRLSATARLTPCPRCQTITLYALDTGYDECDTTRTDLTLLTTGDEIQALLAGRTTHELQAKITGITIRHRNHWRIASNPANTSHHPVAPNHRCGQRIGYPIPWNLLYTEPKGTNSEPPF